MGEKHDSASPITRPERPVPLWTWIVPFFVQVCGRFLSTIVTLSPGIYLFYFPYLTGVPMALWWGPRVFISVFIASVMGAHLAGVTGVMALFLGISELSKVAIGWAFWHFLKIYRKDFHKTRNVFFCWFLCFALPNIVGSYAVMAVLALTGSYPQESFLHNYLKVTLIDTAMGLFISFPIFIFLSNTFTQRGWTPWKKSPFR